MPATDTIDFEREFEGLVRELRALPTEAPDSVRERVRALGEPAPRRSLPRLPWRRSLLVLAPACALGLVVAAVVHGVLNSSSPEQHAVSATGVSGEAQRPKETPHFGAVTTPQDLGQRLSLGPVVASPDLVVPPNLARHQDYQVFMTLRVKDLDALTDRTNEAMRVVRSYGGYVASVHQYTNSGQPGEADLVLRLPIGHVEAALVQLSDLGTVVNRQLSVVDLEQALRQQRERIVRLKVFIARATEQLKGALPADVRIRLELQLQQARADLARATRAHKSTLNEAAFARISLSLRTQTATPVKKGGTGRFERAADDAGSFLAGAGAVILFLLIVLSPLIVLAVLGLLGLRTYRRREERRLLAST